LNKSVAVKLKNTGTASETFNVSATPSVTNSTAQIATDKASVTLAGGATTTVNVNLTGTAQSQGILEGFVTLKSSSSSTDIRIPFWTMFGPPTIFTGGIVDAAAFGKQVAP